MVEAIEQVQEEVMNKIEKIESSDFDVHTDLTSEIQEYYVRAGMDGTVKEVFAVTDIGGPKIEIALLSGRVDGYWASAEHSTAIMDEDAEAAVKELGRRKAEEFERQFNN